MPNITLDWNDLVELLGKEITEEEFTEIIPMIGSDLSEIKDGEVDIEFFPDRPDLYSVEGVARALRTYMELESGLKEYETKPSGVTLTVEESVLDVRGSIVCGLVRDIKMTEPLVKSLIHLQEKLDQTLGRKRRKSSIGLHDFDAVEPPFMYRAVEPTSVTFVPLDRKIEMDMGQILRAHDKGIAYRHILDGLEKYPVIFDRNEDVLSFPPIINGELTRVTDETTNLFIDITGLDQKAVSYALTILTASLAERGASIETVEIIFPDRKLITPDHISKKWELDVNYTNRLLGLQLKRGEIAGCLQRMGFGAKVTGDAESMEVLSPAYRTDILHPIDLIEDVAIAYGYDKFSPDLPNTPTFGNPLKKHPLVKAYRSALIGFGFQEIMTLSLSNEADQFSKMGLEKTETTSIQNPKTKDLTNVRISLFPSLFNILRANKHRDLPQRVFEVGECVMDVRNRTKVAGLIEDSKASFTEVKSVIEGLLRDVNVKFSITLLEHGSYIPGRCSSVILDGIKGDEHEDRLASVGLKEGDVIGNFGEFHPRTIINFDLSYPVVGFELLLV